jgi:uncharacterized protein HemX
LDISSAATAVTCLVTVLGLGLRGHLWIKRSIENSAVERTLQHQEARRNWEILKEADTRQLAEASKNQSDVAKLLESQKRLESTLSDLSTTLKMLSLEHQTLREDVGEIKSDMRDITRRVSDLERGMGNTRR